MTVDRRSRRTARHRVELSPDGELFRRPDDQFAVVIGHRQPRTEVLWAARLHSARFHQNLLRSLQVMVHAERRIIDREGGVATVTVLSRTGRRAAAFAVPYLAGLAALIRAPSPLGKLAGLLAVVVGMYYAPAFERQMRAWWTFDVHDRPWLVADVATVPHRRIGDRLMTTLTATADNAGARMVLRVNPDNHTAIRLYQRHGFISTGERGKSLLMHRPAADGG